MTRGYTPHDLAILIPVLGRPHHIGPLMESIYDTVPDARVVFLVTPDDDAESTCETANREVVRVGWRPVGDFARKINIGYRYTAEPLLFVGATDLRFEPGWFEAAVAQLGPGIGVVGTNDACNPRVIAGEHAVHWLVTRDYADRYGCIDQPGAILHEGYVHEYCDDELVGTAKARGAWAMATDSVVRHLHPMCGADTDAVYDGQTARMRASWTLYRRRRRLWGASSPRRRTGPLRRRRAM